MKTLGKLNEIYIRVIGSEKTVANNGRRKMDKTFTKFK